MSPYSECHELLLSELINAIKQNKKRIEELVNSEDAYINGVHLDILPWHGFICLSFRNRNDETDEKYPYEPGDWKNYLFISDRAFQQSGELIDKLYSNPPNGIEPRYVAHLLYLMAAEVLLDPSVATELQTCGLDAPEINCQEMSLKFEYLVMDADQVFKANYCEVIIATRLKDFLLT